MLFSVRFITSKNLHFVAQATLARGATINNVA